MLIRFLSTWFTQSDLWDYCIDPFHVLLCLVSWGSSACLRGECDLCVLLLRAHSRTQRDSSNQLIPKPPLVQSCHRCTVCPWSSGQRCHIPADCQPPAQPPAWPTGFSCWVDRPATGCLSSSIYILGSVCWLMCPALALNPRGYILRESILRTRIQQLSGVIVVSRGIVLQLPSGVLEHAGAQMLPLACLSQVLALFLWPACNWSLSCWGRLGNRHC